MTSVAKPRKWFQRRRRWHDPRESAPGGQPIPRPGTGSRAQSDLALNSLAVLVAVLYVASQQVLLLLCRSWTRTGVASGRVGSCRFGPAPFTWIFPCSAAPAFSVSLVTPSGVPSLSAYLNPLEPAGFQHGFVPHIPSAGARALSFSPDMS